MPPVFPNPFIWYRLTISKFPGICLDVVNDGTSQTQGKLQMAKVGDYSGQHWQFLPSPEGSFCLRTMYTGTDMLLVSENCDARLSRDTELEGWRWYVEPLSANEESPVRLRVDLRGAPDERYYLGPRISPHWFNGKRLHTMKLEEAIQHGDLEWTLTEINPVRMPEFGLSPPVPSYSTDDGQTNVLGSSGELEYSIIEPASLVVSIDESPQQILGWSYRLDPIRDTFSYLDAYKLQWKECVIDRGQDLSRSGPGLKFSAWSSTSSKFDFCMLSSFASLFNSEKTIIVDVSHGFSDPRAIAHGEEIPLSHELDEHQYSESPPTYLCKSLLFSLQTTENGINFIFYISKGTTIVQVDDVSSPLGHGSGILTFRMLDDWTRITVPVDNILRIGVEGPVPLELTWWDKQFQDQETIPIQHISYLGHGSQAVVDKVFYSGRVFARKLIRTIARVPLVTAHRKLEAIKRVQTHRHVVNILGIYTQSETVGILLHPVAECDLQTALERFGDPDSGLFAGRMSYRDYENRFFEYFGCLAHALAFIHLKSILHRDIRPRKVLATFNGPIFADFGIERDFSGSTFSTSSSSREKNYEYCAPEIVTGREFGRGADVYSLGCIFLELFTVLTHRDTFNDCHLRRRTEDDSSYHANPEKVNAWITELMHVELRSASIPHNSRLRLLSVIQEMVNPIVERRPSALDVWNFTTTSTLERGGATGDSESRPRMCGVCCFDRPRY